MSPKNNSYGYFAFSLVELLVVIGIVTLLVGVLLPALSAAKDDGKRAVCIQNQHQLAVSTATLVQNNKGNYFPYLNFTCASNSNGTISVLTTRRNEYSGGWNFYKPAEFVCPSDVRPGTVSIRKADGTTQTMPSSYGYHIRMMYNSISMFSQRLGPASEVVLFYDGSMSGNDSVTGVNIEGNYISTMDFALSAVQYRHRKRWASGVYVDGHVQTFDVGTTNYYYSFGGGGNSVINLMGNAVSAGSTTVSTTTTGSTTVSTTTTGNANGNGNGQANGLANGNSNGNANLGANGGSNGQANGLANGNSNGNANGNANGNGTTTTTTGVTTSVTTTTTTTTGATTGTTGGTVSSSTGTYSYLDGVDTTTPSRGTGGAGGGLLTSGAVDDERRGP
jgi:prepilin-type processing-associated H-X9-DG protein